MKKKKMLENKKVLCEKVVAGNAKGDGGSFN